MMFDNTPSIRNTGKMAKACGDFPFIRKRIISKMDIKEVVTRSNIILFQAVDLLLKEGNIC